MLVASNINAVHECGADHCKLYRTHIKAVVVNPLHSSVYRRSRVSLTWRVCTYTYVPLILIQIYPVSLEADKQDLLMYVAYLWGCSHCHLQCHVDHSIAVAMAWHSFSSLGSR